MNWGHGIILAIGAFIVVIMTMVVISVRMDGIELVTEDYYEKEIKYQDRIDSQNSAILLDREIIAFNTASQELIFDLPKGTKATLELFRPSDESLDQTLDFTVESDDKMIVKTDQLKKGYWKAQLQWEENGVLFYQEKKLSL